MRTIKKGILSIIALGAISSCSTTLVEQPASSPVAATSAQESPYQENWDSLAAHDAAPQWYQDAKLGIYLHWGVYSVPAFGTEWYPRNMHFKGRKENLHHIATYGELNEFGYHDFVPMFKGEHFDAVAWVTLFKKAALNLPAR